MDYLTTVRHAVTSISICAAVAGSDLVKGQAVSLEMRDGLLVATKEVGEGAQGIAISDAQKGDDIGVTNIEGIVKLEIGKVTILRIPGTLEGGSGRVNLERLRQEVKGSSMICAIGIEASVALRRINISPSYFYGVKEATIEAARSGLEPHIVCIEEEVPGLVSMLEEEKVNYQLVDLGKGRTPSRR